MCSVICLFERIRGDEPTISICDTEFCQGTLPCRIQNTETQLFVLGNHILEYFALIHLLLHHFGIGLNLICCWLVLTVDAVGGKRVRQKEYYLLVFSALCTVLFWPTVLRKLWFGVISKGKLFNYHQNKLYMAIIILINSSSETAYITVISNSTTLNEC